MRTVLYPGSFDPVTNGHFDLIERASRIFDKVYVAVAVNADKQPMFTVEERFETIRRVAEINNISNVEPVHFSGLLVDAVNDLGVCAVIRGLRAVTDFEYELQMALMNRQLNAQCETIFMTPSPQYSFVSSKLIKEVARHGGDITQYVPPIVAEALATKL